MRASTSQFSGIDHTAGFFIKIGLILFVMIAGMLATLFSNGNNLVPICVMLLIVVFVVLYIEKTILDTGPLSSAVVYSDPRMYSDSPNLRQSASTSSSPYR